MQDIKDWFKEKDFSKGIALLTKYNRRQLAVNLGRKESEYNLNKMAYELGKIGNVDNVVNGLKTLTSVETTEPLSRSAAGSPSTGSPSTIDKVGDNAERLYAEKAEIWNKEAALRNKLVEFEDSGADGLALTPELQKQRQDLIDEISYYNDRRIEIEGIVKIFENTGKMPESTTTNDDGGEMSIEQLFIRKNNLISYLSRENKKLLTLEPDTEKYIDVKNRIAKFEFELGEINKKIV